MSVSLRVCKPMCERLCIGERWCVFGRGCMCVCECKRGREMISFKKS